MKKKVYIILIIALLMFPTMVFASTKTSSGEYGFNSICENWLGINISASAYDRKTTITTDVVSNRTISISCKGRCKAYMYYGDYGDLSSLDKNTEISDEDEDLPDDVSVKKKTFNDSYNGWSVAPGKEALVIVVSLNVKECKTTDPKTGACTEWKKECKEKDNKGNCTKWGYPRKVAQEEQCTGSGDKRVCQMVDVKRNIDCDENGENCKSVTVTCPRGKFEADGSDLTDAGDIKITGNGMAMFIQNPKESGLVRNVRNRLDGEFREQCVKAYNGKYDSKSESDTKLYSLEPGSADLEKYRSQYYNKFLGYCDQKDFAYNLKEKQIKKISNRLLKVFYNAKNFESKEFKDIETVKGEIRNIKQQNPGIKEVSDVSRTQELACDYKNGNNPGEKNYLYVEKPDPIIAHLHTGDVPVCKTICYEHLKVKYDPPQTVLAGLCFQYKVTVKSVSECGIKKDFNLSKVATKNPCSPSPICENKSGHTQAGPNENFDKCITSCDGGKYSQKCINSCYKKVYEKSSNKTQKTSSNNDSYSVSMLNNVKNNYSVRRLANKEYEEDELKNYHKESNNPACNTNNIINYVHSNNDRKLSECAEYYFQAKALYPKGKFNDDGTAWNSYVGNDGAYDKATTNIPMQIARAAPFYLRSEEVTKDLLKWLVVPAWKPPFWKKYNIDADGIKRQYSTRFVCHQVCGFTGCSSKDALTNTEFSQMTAEDLEELANKLEECNVSSSCDSKAEEKTTTFTIGVDNTILNDISDTSKGETATEPNVSDGKTVVGKTIPKLPEHNDINIFTPEFTDKITGQSLDRRTTTGIVGLCYDKERYSTPHYQTTITYPGTYRVYKSGKILYKKPASEGTYDYLDKEYCVPNNIANVNEEYAIWATKKFDQNYYNSNIRDKFIPKNNIRASLGSGNNGFGKYSWKINFSCFYSSYNNWGCPPSDPNYPECSPGNNNCDSDDSTRLCNTRFRVVDPSHLFPKADGSTLSGGVGEEWPFNWTSDAQDKSLKDGGESLIGGAGYGINPVDYKNKIENEVLFDDPNSYIYHIHIGKDKIPMIKNYVKTHGYTEFNGTLMPIGNSKVKYYTVNSKITDMIGSDNFKRKSDLRGRNGR